MASKEMLAILTIVVVVALPAIALPAIAEAEEFIVGDDLGWGLKVNYTEWAIGKNFKVGDKLVFKYAFGEHNLVKISGPGFKACDSSMALETLYTGNDVITLATAGRKWYICGISGHCEAGMKLVIDVAGEGMAPGMAPSAPGPASSGHVAAAPAPLMLLLLLVIAVVLSVVLI